MTCEATLHGEQEARGVANACLLGLIGLPVGENSRNGVAAGRFDRREGFVRIVLVGHVGKDLREIQELLRHRNIRTTVRYTHVGYEQTRQTAEALSQALE
jgi:hypothetical protein